MSAPPTIRAGCSRRLEIHQANFAVATRHMSCDDIGELIQMLMAEVGGLPIPLTESRYAAEAFAKRRKFSRIKGSFGREALPLSIRRFVFDRDRRTCRYCQASLDWTDYHCDHVHPVSLGGSDALTNLAAACEACNRSKAAKPLKAWLATR